MSYFPPQEADLKNATEMPSPISLEFDLAALAAGRTGLAQWPQ
jgi:hypothetical protein